MIRNGEFVEEISKGLLGANSDNSIEVDKRNLWSGVCYDSPNPEGEISKIKPGDEIWYSARFHSVQFESPFLQEEQPLRISFMRSAEMMETPK